VDAGIHKCEWRADLDRDATPATHKLRETLLAEGFDGVVYPSFMSPGGRCVALWRWNALGAPSLKVIDPEGRLPKSAASWL
jgi:RES domain-containing protein